MRVFVSLGVVKRGFGAGSDGFVIFWGDAEVVKVGLFLLLGARVLCGFVVFVDFGCFLRAGFLGFVWI